MAQAASIPPNFTPSLALIRVCGVLLVAAPFTAAAMGGPAAIWVATAMTGSLLLLAFVLAGRERSNASRWCSSVDRLVFAGIALSVLQVIDRNGSVESSAWLRQILACGLGFYSLLALARRTPGASDALWGVFGLASFGLGLHAMWASTGGLDRLVAWSAEADRAWASQFGLGKVMLVTTLMTAGRAREPGASAAWRVAVLAGGLGTLLHASVGGLGLGSQALALLEQPLYFSVTIVALLLIASLAKRAWTLRRERHQEAWRWRGLGLAFMAVGAIAALGGASGGESLRILVTLAAVTTLVAAEEPVAEAAASIASLESPTANPEQRRAA